MKSLIISYRNTKGVIIRKKIKRKIIIMIIRNIGGL